MSGFSITVTSPKTLMIILAVCTTAAATRVAAKVATREKKEDRGSPATGWWCKNAADGENFTVHQQQGCSDNTLQKEKKQSRTLSTNRISSFSTVSVVERQLKSS